MGAKCYACKIGEDIKESQDNISLLNFQKKYPIGKGGYGRVRNYKYNNILLNIYRFGKCNLNRIIKYMQ